MLGGIPDYCAPMVLGIENSVPNLTADYVKNLLLQKNFVDKHIGESGSALAVKMGKKRVDRKDKRGKSVNKEVKCYICEKNHYAKYCPERKGDKSAKVLLSSFLVDQTKTDWYMGTGIF